MKKNLLVKVLCCLGSWILFVLAIKQADKAAEFAAIQTADLIVELKDKKQIG